MNRDDRPDTRERIFWTAVDLFSTVGYGESSMRELAARVGIKPASLYHHFPSKEALLDEIFEYFLARDAVYRTSESFVVANARDRSVDEIMESLVVRYTADEGFHNMNKIVRIALGYQFENQKARDVFNHIYFTVSLGARERALAAMIEQGIFEPFDHRTVAYALTSFSMMLFVQCANEQLAVEAYAERYNAGMNDIVKLLSGTIRKRTPAS